MTGSTIRVKCENSYRSATRSTCAPNSSQSIGAPSALFAMNWIVAGRPPNRSDCSVICCCWYSLSATTAVIAPTDTAMPMRLSSTRSL